jgi:hypothetical protein
MTKIVDATNALDNKINTMKQATNTALENINQPT